MPTRGGTHRYNTLGISTWGISLHLNELCGCERRGCTSVFGKNPCTSYGPSWCSAVLSVQRQEDLSNEASWICSREASRAHTAPSRKWWCRDTGVCREGCWQLNISVLKTFCHFHLIFNHPCPLQPPSSSDRNALVSHSERECEDRGVVWSAHLLHVEHRRGGCGDLIPWLRERSVWLDYNVCHHKSFPVTIIGRFLKNPSGSGFFYREYTPCY